jgi:hypothetical protein
MLSVAITGATSDAQSAARPVTLISVRASGSVSGPASASAQAIVFEAAPLGGAARQLVATFALAGGIPAPSASLHYGHDYSIGAVSCSSQSCSVTVSFQPTLPGIRPDALFLTSAGQRVASVPLSGTGSAPFAVLQPISTASATSSLAGADPAAVLDENGTLYALDAAGDSVTATTSLGVASVLPIEGLNGAHGLAIDGAGVLYLLPGTEQKSLITFDTVERVQGAVLLPVAASSIDSIATGTTGDLFAVVSTAKLLYTVHPDGTAAQSVLAASASPATSALAVAARTAAGLKATTATEGLSDAGSGSFSVLGTDAAGTLYANSGGSLLALAAPGYTSAVATLPAAVAVGHDGSLVVDSSAGPVRLDRTQTELDFGSVAPGAAATPQVAKLYNAGNQPLTLTDVRVAGNGFTIASAPNNGCSAGSVVAPGASCEIAVALDAPKSGIATGTLSVASDSLNGTGTGASSMLSVPVKANTAGSQALLTPLSLIFPNTTVNVASTPQVITLSNPGTAALNLSSIALTGAASGSYSVTNTCISATVTSLAPGASCTISVTFKPLTAASQSAVLSVGDDVNGVTGSTQTVTLIGLGLAAPAPVILFTAVSQNGLAQATSTTSASLGTLSFGSATNPVLEINAASPTSYTGTVTLVNTGNLALTLSPIQLILSGTSTVLPFTQTNNCGATLAIGASCVVTVNFVAPAGVGGTYTAELVLVDNAANSPQTFGISGIVTTSDYTLSASTTTLTLPSKGGTGQVVITAVPDAGPFLTPISLSVFGVPLAATYSFSPIAITAVTTPGTSTLSITLPNYQNVVLSSLSMPARPALLRFGLPAAASLLMGLGFIRRRRRMPRLTQALSVLMFVLLSVAATCATGCGSGVPVSGGVAPGTYYLTVTGSSADGLQTTPGATHQATFALVVQ